MTDKPFVPVGRVVKTHGLKGEVSVAAATGTPFLLQDGLELWVIPPAPGVPRTLTVSGVRQGPKGPLVSFSEITTIDGAATIAGRELLARAEDLPETALDEMEPEIEGYSVTDTRHGSLGEVTDTIITGANDVWVVEGPFGEVLIPVIDDVVLEIDDEARSITVTLLEGLLPGEGEEA